MPQFALDNVIATLKIGATTYTNVVSLDAPEIGVTINEHTQFGGDGWVRKTAGVKNVGNITASIVFDPTVMAALMLLLTPTGAGYRPQVEQSCELIFGAAAASGKFTFTGLIASIKPPPAGSPQEDAVIAITFAVDGALVWVAPV
jgi:hypothetical protein